jgi:hypothetical protein
VFHGYAGDFSANQLGVCEERSLPYSKSVEFSESDVDEDGSRSGGFHRRVSESGGILDFLGGVVSHLTREN